MGGVCSLQAILHSKENTVFSQAHPALQEGVNVPVSVREYTHQRTSLSQGLDVVWGVGTNTIGSGI